jgi:hypothetical protein
MPIITALPIGTEENYENSQSSRFLDDVLNPRPPEKKSPAHLISTLSSPRKLINGYKYQTILPVAFHGHETWSLILRDENARLKVRLLSKKGK